MEVSDRKVSHAIKTCQLNRIYETTGFKKQYGKNYTDIKISSGWVPIRRQIWNYV